jgi:malonyl-CoA/methylmalonyl-CoA synthetase
MAFLILKPLFCLLSSVSSKKSPTLYRVSGRGFCSLANEKIKESSETLITPVFQIATNHLHKVALKDQNGVHTYQEVLRKSLLLAKKIQEKIGVNRTQERIVFLCPNDVTYVLAQWACWASGHIGEFHFYYHFVNFSLLAIKSLKSICYVHQNNCMCVLYNTVHS